MSLQGEEIRTQISTEGRWPCEDGTEIEVLGAINQGATKAEEGRKHPSLDLGLLNFSTVRLNFCCSIMQLRYFVMETSGHDTDVNRPCASRSEDRAAKAQVLGP